MHHPGSLFNRLTKLFRPQAARLLLITLILSGLLAGCSSPETTSVSSNSDAASTAPTADKLKASPQQTLAAIPLAFEQNVGQTDAQVRFIARAKGYQTFLTADSMVFKLKDGRADAAPPTKPTEPTASSYSVVRMQLIEASSNPAVVLKDGWATPANYFIGNDASQWLTAPNFGGVEYQNIYPGVNMQFESVGRDLRYNFVIQPGSNPGLVRLRFDGAKQLEIGKAGELIITTAGNGKLVHSAPVLYQQIEGERVAVNGKFILDEIGQSVGFEVGNYQSALPLVIDPVITYSTYLTSSRDDEAAGIAVDSSGNIYVTGVTYANNFPTVNQYQTYQARVDAFVSKINPNLSGAASLVYSTYLGGTGFYDNATGIAVDGSGNIYVTGYTYSNDFPLVNPFQTFEGSGDAFVSKFNPNLVGKATLLYSTYLGGSGNDSSNAIALDSSGLVYITGSTGSANFPVLNPYQAFQGVVDSFVAKLNPNLIGQAELLYATFLGGNDYDSGAGIAVNSSGIIYVAGDTYSTNFPVVNPYQTYQDNRDTFISRINPGLSGAATLISSSYFGGNGYDEANAIAVDSDGFAYVTGSTNSANFPTVNTYQGYQGLTFQDAFVSKFNLNASGAAVLLYSTYLGGSASDYATSITVDSNGLIYITGSTYSTDFPTVNSIQTFQGQGDVFVSRLNPALKGTAALVYSSYLGGTNLDIGTGVAISKDGNVYVTGNTYSNNFPVVNQYQTGDALNFDDVFVTKLVFVNLTAASGTNQSSQINTAFAQPLQVQVRDSLNNPMAGVAVNFAVPASGASANLSSTTASTNSSGVATVTATANGVPGSYAVTAVVAGETAPVNFTLTNNGLPNNGNGTIKLLPATVRVAFAGFGGSTAPVLTAVGANPANPLNSSSVAIQVGGVSGIPATAKGIIGTLTNVGCNGGGNLRFWTGNTVPNAVNLNVPGALSKLNLTASFTTPLDASGKVNLGFGSVTGNSCGYAVDVIGYIASPAANAANVSLLGTTVRVQYAGFGGSSNPVLTAVGATPANPTSTSSTGLSVGNTNGIPVDAKGIIGSLTNVGCNGGGNLRFWTGSTVPNAVNLNVPGAMPNLNLTASFTIPLDTSGKVNLGYGSVAGNSCGYAVDVIGYVK